MRVYELRVDPAKFVTLETIDAADLDVFIDGFAGRPMAEEWPSPKVRITPGDVSAGRLVGDFPNLSGSVPVLSRRAVELLKDVLASRGELLPLRCDDGEYWAFNVLAVLDIMDEERSRGEYIAPGRLVTLQELVPRQRLDGALLPIFKLPQWLKGRAVITQVFLDAVIDHGLTGLDPKPLGDA